MANLADVRFLKDPTGRMWVAVVTSAMQYSDGFKGCNWQLYSPEGKIVTYGISRGWDGEGAGSALSAHDYARRAAKRRWKKIVPC